MDIMSGLVIIVFTVGVFVIIALSITHGGGSSPSETPRQAMWTRTVTYGPRCTSVRIVDDRLIKVCILEPNHDGDHHYKIIDLGGPERNDEDLS